MPMFRTHSIYIRTFLEYTNDRGALNFIYELDKTQYGAATATAAI